MTAILLCVIALYCFGSWLWLAFRTFKYNEDWSEDTFNLGLVGTVAVAALHIGDKLADTIQLTSTVVP